MRRKFSGLFAASVLCSILAILVVAIYVRSAFVDDFITFEHYLPAQHAELTWGITTIYGTIWCSRYWEWTDVLQSADANNAEQASTGWRYRPTRIKRPFSFRDLFQFDHHYEEMDVHPSDIVPGAPNHEAKVKISSFVFPLWPLLLLSLIAPMAQITVWARRRRRAGEEYLAKPSF